MSYSKNISKTLEVFSMNLGTILAVYLLLSLINLISGFSLGLSFKWASSVDFIQAMDKIAAIKTETNIISSLVQGILTYFIIGTNQIAILNFLRGGQYNIDTIKDIVKENYKDLAILSAILTIINKVLSLIPIVGGILAIVAALAFSFTFFLFYDYRSDNPQNYLKGSASLTQGHKLNLFFLILLFSILPIVLGIVLLVVSFISKNLTLGVVVIIATFLLVNLTSVLISISQSVYYDELIQEDQSFE